MSKVKRGFLYTGLVAGVLLCVSALWFSGCGKGGIADSKGAKGYSLPEIMIIAAAEKNKYEEVCTDQIWDVSASEDGTSFAGYLTEQIKNFMDEMKLINMLADEKNIELTAVERSCMAAAADEYYKSLSESDIAGMGLTEEQVLNVYEDYCLASQAVEELTKEVNLEVSDSEAKVITILQVKTNSRDIADSFSQAASQEAADYNKAAEAAGLSVVQRQLGRAEESQSFEDTAFGLTTGQISGVIADGETFYVLKCVSDYDEEATKMRKDVIFAERKKKAFEEIYSDYKEGVNLSYNGDPWEKLNLSEMTYARNTDFFEIYKKHMAQ